MAVVGREANPKGWNANDGSDVELKGKVGQKKKQTEKRWSLLWRESSYRVYSSYFGLKCTSSASLAAATSSPPAPSTNPNPFRGTCVRS